MYELFETNPSPPSRYLKAWWFTTTRWDKVRKIARKGHSVTLGLVLRGFIYTTFGLGASHTGFWAGLSGKACLAWPMGSSLRPMSEEH